MHHPSTQRSKTTAPARCFRAITPLRSMLRSLLVIGLLIPSMAVFGQTFTVLHSFAGGPDGNFPQGPLLQGQHGYLYGTTRGNTVFKIAPDGTGYSVVCDLNNGSVGASVSGVSQGADGTLYGTSIFGGGLGYGGIWSVRPDGTGLTLLHAFNGFDGGFPQSAPAPGGDGFLYGSTEVGGSGFSPGDGFGIGVIYKIATDGTNFSVLRYFSGFDGLFAFGGLILGADGYLYGTTGFGGGLGNAFKISRDGLTFQTLHSFAPGGYGGAVPVANLVQAPDGTLYATTDESSIGYGGILSRFGPDGTGFAELVTFDPFDGANPIIGGADQLPHVTVALGQDGLLYGSTVTGGPSGSLYSVAKDGSGLTTLYTFSPYDSNHINSDGAFPLASVIASDGNLYGTTAGGGAYGQGTIFKFNLDNTPPTITATANPSQLWPPIGNMVPVTISGTITDTGSGVDTASGAYSTVDSYGAVQPAGTFTINADGTYSCTLSLEASRKGSDKAGRTYTVTITAKDKAGNVGTATVVVTVPHDQGH